MHAVLIPKKRSGLTRLSRSDPSHKPLLGHLLWAASEVAKQEGLLPGFRVVINDGPLGCEFCSWFVFLLCFRACARASFFFFPRRRRLPSVAHVFSLL